MLSSVRSIAASRGDGGGPSAVASVLIPISIYCLSIGIYLHPLTSSPTPSIPPPPDNDHDDHRDDRGGRDRRYWNLIYDPTPQLDEIHIMSPDNFDVQSSSSRTTDDDDAENNNSRPWTDAWDNDYWGRPLSGEEEEGRQSASSSADRRPPSRGFEGEKEEEEGEDLASELFVHRFVNVLIHAAVVQIVGVVSTLLFRRDDRYARYASQLLFAIHPVHVEAVVNVANRPHVLALLFNATIVDPDVPLLAAAVLAAMGLLTAETAIFQFPAIVLTMTAIRYRECIDRTTTEDVRCDGSRGGGTDVASSSGEEKKRKRSSRRGRRSPLRKTFFALLPRYVLLVVISTTYLLYRHYNDTLSIPTGLIRPAENPFYQKVTDEWTLGQRVVNYSYVLSLHVLKSFGVEVVGYSHEYGFDCIPEILSMGDPRLLCPVGIACLFASLAAWSWFGRIDAPVGGGGKRGKGNGRREREERTHRFLLVLVFFAWMATLFPISGILRVGTFVADRIAVASSFGTCLFAGRALAWRRPSSRAPSPNEKEDDGIVVAAEDDGGAEGRGGGTSVRRISAAVLFCLGACALARRTHARAAQWMDSVTLMESSLRACPRSIKSNLELSKIYSGLVPHMLDLDRSLSLIDTAASIDPDFCDVHQQYSLLYFSQSKYKEFERELAQSLRCPFTMGQAMGNWNKYWTYVLEDGRDKKARKRYDKYMREIQADIDEAEREEETRASAAGGGGRVEEEL